MGFLLELLGDLVVSGSVEVMEDLHEAKRTHRRPARWRLILAGIAYLVWSLVTAGIVLVTSGLSFLALNRRDVALLTIAVCLCALSIFALLRWWRYTRLFIFKKI